METGGIMEGTRVEAPNQCWDVLHFNMAHCRALLMYRGGPKVKRYARKVRHAKRGVRARACPILASLVKLSLKIHVFGDWKHVV